MTGLDKDIFRATRKLTTLLNEACNHWNYLCPYLEKLGIAANLALEGYKMDYPKDVKSLIAEKPTPPRNCNVGTEWEQIERHRKWCHETSCHHCVGWSCFARWAQMPYEEGGSK